MSLGLENLGKSHNMAHPIFVESGSEKVDTVDVKQMVAVMAWFQLTLC